MSTKLIFSAAPTLFVAVRQHVVIPVSPLAPLASLSSPVPAMSLTQRSQGSHHNRVPQSNSVPSPFHHRCVPALTKPHVYSEHPAQQAGRRKSAPTAHPVIKKNALAGHAVTEDGFYFGVLRDGEAWQLHHILAGPSHGTMVFELETVLRDSGGMSVWVCRNLGVPTYILSLHISPFPLPLA